MKRKRKKIINPGISFGEREMIAAIETPYIKEKINIVIRVILELYDTEYIIFHSQIYRKCSHLRKKEIKHKNYNISQKEIQKALKHLVNINAIEQIKMTKKVRAKQGIYDIKSKFNEANIIVYRIKNKERFGEKYV